MVARDQLTLAFRQVERQPVGLADHRDQVDQERRQQQHREPGRVVQPDAEPVELGAVRLRLHDRGGGQRPGVEEDRDECQSHGDLVADHLGRRPQAAQQRVRRGRGPPGQHDPVHAQGTHREDQQHAHRQVGELQRGLHPRDRHDGPERDDREADERGDHRQRGRDHEQDLVHAERGDVLLERQLDAVQQRLQQPERPGPVRPGALLHPPDHPALGPDHEQRAEQEEQEDGEHLDDDQPPGVVPEIGQRRILCLDGQAGHGALLTVTTLPWPAPSSLRTAQPAELAGSQTTRSGMSAISAGTVMVPCSVATVTLPPSLTPASAAVAADIFATATRAVPARFGSPSCIRPASRRLCQVARTA